MKTLLLMRHAKSDWDADYTTDHERPLNARGIRSARLMGRMLTSLELVPDRIISSTAIRAVATTNNAVEAGGWGAAVELEDDFYGTGPDTVLQRASAAPDVGHLMLVGHQPTWSMLVHRLTGAAADMKTASVAVIELMAGDWTSLPDGHGVLTALINPRSLFGSEWDHDR